MSAHRAIRSALDTSKIAYGLRCRSLRPLWADRANVISHRPGGGDCGQFGLCRSQSWKAGKLGMTRSLAIEAGRHNITVNCIGPGWIETGSSSEAAVIAGRHTPAGRPVRPEEIGHVAVFLASAEAS
jgi:NAD(P)-dependent dehydrogenase (short-subunit alcohol dehydrogenase family)